jgi:hypothetical protein
MPQFRQRRIVGMWQVFDDLGFDPDRAVTEHTYPVRYEKRLLYIVGHRQSGD